MPVYLMLCRMHYLTRIVNENQYPEESEWWILKLMVFWITILLL